MSEVEVTDTESALAYVQEQEAASVTEAPQPPVPSLFELNYQDPEVIHLIKTLIAPGHTNEELALFVMYCQQTRLNPLARQIYSLKRKQYDSASRGYIEKQSIQTSIDGFRLIADRTRKYAGQKGPFWCGPDGEWRDVWLDPANPPTAARVGVMRHDFDDVLWGIALYKAYVQTNSQGDPVSRWKTDPAGMLAKCAESLALRRAFPQELSGLYTYEEMQAADSTPVVVQAPTLPATTGGTEKTQTRAQETLEKTRRSSAKPGVDPEMEKWLAVYESGMLPSEFSEKVASRMTVEDAGKLLTLRDKKPLSGYVTDDLRRLKTGIMSTGVKRALHAPEMVLLVAVDKLVNHYDPEKKEDGNG